MKLQSHGKETDAEWPPRFVKFRLKTDAGNELAFVNSRRFGKVWLVEDSQNNPLNRLGYDAHDGLPPAKQLFDELQGKKANLKAKLLDQAWIAGLGNWLVDDILYAAGISPHRRVGELTLDEVKALRKATKSIVDKAVKVEADSTRFPKAWLFHQRWEAKKGGELGDGHLGGDRGWPDNRLVTQPAALNQRSRSGRNLSIGPILCLVARQSSVRHIEVMASLLPERLICR